MNSLWWKFRDAWCWPFGHVLYFPIRGRWECACGVCTIGSEGMPLDYQIESLRIYWRRLRRPSQACHHWNVFRMTLLRCPDCHGRLWVRA